MGSNPIVSASQSLLKGQARKLLYAGSGNTRIEAAPAKAKQHPEKAGFESPSSKEASEPKEVIGEVFQRDPIDLLVMGAYGHTSTIYRRPHNH